MYAIALVRYRRPIEEVILNQEAHRAYLRQLKADGTLLAAGPNRHPPLRRDVPAPRPRRHAARRPRQHPRQRSLLSAGVAQDRAAAWKAVIGKEDLEIKV